MEHFRWQLTTSGSGRIVSAIPAWCVYESTGFHLGNIGQKDLSGTRLGHGDVLNPEALAALMHRTFCLGARLEVVVSLESGGVARSHRRIGIPLASGGVEGAPKIQ